MMRRRGSRCIGGGFRGFLRSIRIFRLVIGVLVYWYIDISLFGSQDKSTDRQSASRSVSYSTTDQ